MEQLAPTVAPTTVPSPCLTACASHAFLHLSCRLLLSALRPMATASSTALPPSPTSTCVGRWPLALRIGRAPVIHGVASSGRAGNDKPAPGLPLAWRCSYLVALLLRAASSKEAPLPSRLQSSASTNQQISVAAARISPAVVYHIHTSPPGTVNAISHYNCSLGSPI